MERIVGAPRFAKTNGVDDCVGAIRASKDNSSHNFFFALRTHPCCVSGCLIAFCRLRAETRRTLREANALRLAHARER
ncbi:hypothetical protein CQW49_01115 [Methylosinus trichosporium OB3b]|uniref:Uncharacterized protein n=1 Tax=Methylosinus trichosporium (strain ATCC 35070 / NCIMB 11131 / UNIQEM 75 / OB3b) TaxID=595536 RepID=A0A2D2CV64_METT3|nr:hypothetical protein CQW49_01115 [Methylosinus trichosporium OB3b]OBS51728.1 hypothetical protein A8B73_15000 [Methylosinus sp. 3S-1]